MLFISKTLPYSFCACVRNTPKIVKFVIGKMKLVSFSLCLGALPLDPKCILHNYVVNVLATCPKGILVVHKVIFLYYNVFFLKKIRYSYM